MANHTAGAEGGMPFYRGQKRGNGRVPNRVEQIISDRIKHKRYKADVTRGAGLRTGDKKGEQVTNIQCVLLIFVGFSVVVFFFYRVVIR